LPLDYTYYPLRYPCAIPVIMPLFTKPQLKRLSNIFDNAGQVMLGYLVLDPIISTSGFTKVFVTTSFGILITVSFWLISLILERNYL